MKFFNNSPISKHAMISMFSLLFLMSNAQAQGPVLLEIKWNAGTTYNRHNVTLIEMHSGGSMISRNRTETDLSMVAATHPRGVLVSMKNKRLQAALSAGGSDMGSYDSDNPAPSSEMMKSMFSEVLASEIKFVMTPEGAVEVDPASLPAGGAGASDVMERMMRQWIDLMPSEAVEPGQTWTKEMEIPLGVLDKMLSRVSVTFVEVIERDGRSLARIEVRGAPAEGPQWKIDTYEADGLLDIELGQIVEADMKIEGSGQVGMKIKVAITEKQISVE
ncbi:MAG: hypothetical protein ACSHX0_09610 [Akkermansiaceae bacterium]